MRALLVLLSWAALVSVDATLVPHKPPLTAPGPPRLVWCAPFLSGGGLCDEAVAFGRALRGRRGGFAIVPHGDSINDKYVAALDDTTKNELQLMFDQSSGGARRDLSNSVVVCHSEPGAWSAPTPMWKTPVAFQCPPPNQKIRYTVGRCMFETDQLPSGWLARFAFVNELWVPTHFHRQVFIEAGVAPHKVVVMPEPVNVDWFNPARVTAVSEAELVRHQVYGSATANAPPKCRLLAIGKWEKRKGYDVLLPAFVREFGSDDAVELLIVSSSFHDERDWKVRVAAALGPHAGTAARVRIVENVSTVVLSKIYRSATAFVLPSRGEGWGRPYAEAMAMQLPVIATNWSGQTHFINDTNALPLRFELVKRADGSPFARHRWAEPDAAHLQQLMRRVCSNDVDGSLRVMGERARATMLQYSFANVARLVEERIDIIANMR